MIANRAWVARGMLFGAIAAFWPVWSWYAMRLRDGNGEPWGIVAILTAFLILVLRGPGKPLRSKGLLSPALLLAVYSLAYPITPPLGRAAIALSVLALLAGRSRGRGTLDVGIWGLFMLALPLFATLQFLVAFPLRVLVGELATPLLQLSGVQVRPLGTVLQWGPQQVVIDAPCSGIKMLWAGAFLAFAAIAVTGASSRAAAQLLLVTAAAVVAANVLRVCALFYLETGLITAPAFAHEAVGLVCFAFAAAAVVAGAGRLRGRGA